jgi:DNA-binding transcriptional LysR family regulator
VASGLAQRTAGSHKEGFVAACMKAGFSPDIHLEVTEPMTALRLVGAGLGIAMLQRNLRSSAPENVVLREVPWMQYNTPVWAAWHRINLRPLVAMAKEVLLSGESSGLGPGFAQSGRRGLVRVGVSAATGSGQAK